MKIDCNLHDHLSEITFCSLQSDETYSVFKKVHRRLLKYCLYAIYNYTSFTLKTNFSQATLFSINNLNPSLADSKPGGSTLNGAVFI